jgi:hypothetical protein
VTAENVDDAPEIVSFCYIGELALQGKTLLPADVREMDLHLPVVSQESLKSDPKRDRAGNNGEEEVVLMFAEEANSPRSGYA